MLEYRKNNNAMKNFLFRPEANHKCFNSLPLTQFYTIMEYFIITTLCKNILKVVDVYT